MKITATYEERVQQNTAELESIRQRTAERIARLSVGKRYRFGKYVGALQSIRQDSHMPSMAWVVLVSRLNVAHSFMWIVA